MTTAKWMIVGLFLGFSVSSALSCGGAKPCGPKECPFGCCDAMGSCQVGSSDSQCGAQGAVCTSCALATRCSFGLCSGIGSGGGPGGGSGGSGGGTTGGGTGGGSLGGGTGGSFGGGTGGSFGGGTGGGSFGGGAGGGSFGGGTGGGAFGGGTGGGAPPCGPSSCAAGCCFSGQCLLPPNSTNDFACGRNGVTCVDCTTSLRVCSASTATCISGAGGGGGATGGGAGGGATGGGTGGAGGGFAGGATCSSPVILPGPGIYNDSNLTAGNDYEFADSLPCQGSSSNGGGPEKIYRVTVLAGQTLSVTLTPAFDATLNFIIGASNCGGPPGSGLIPVCVAGSDDPEQNSWTNTLGTSTQVLIMVESYSTTGGTYTLEYTIN